MPSEPRTSSLTVGTRGKSRDNKNKVTNEVLIMDEVNKIELLTNTKKFKF